MDLWPDDGPAGHDHGAGLVSTFGDSTPAGDHKSDLVLTTVRVLRTVEAAMAHCQPCLSWHGTIMATRWPLSQVLGVQIGMAAALLWETRDDTTRWWLIRKLPAAAKDLVRMCAPGVPGMEAEVGRALKSLVLTQPKVARSAVWDMVTWLGTGYTSRARQRVARETG